MPELRRRDLLKTVGVAGAASMLTTGWTTAAHAAPGRIEYVTVFERGETEDYHTFRIPAIVRAVDGTLLAFAHGRVNNAEDFGHSDVVLKRSTDGGRTWGPLQVVATDPPHKVGNQVPVVDEITGRIHLFFVRTAGHVTGDDVVQDRVTPEEAPRPHVIYSDDHGATWSEWREITDDVKLPGMRWYVGGPVHGIQLPKGPYAGRLVVPGNHNFLPATEEQPAVVGVHVVYSDDHGETWRIGGAIGEYDDGIIIPNETTVVELADGTLYFNTRDHQGTAPGNRAATTSTDGGTTFDGPFRIVPDLVTPIIQGSLLEMTRRTDRNERIVFSAPSHPSSRERLAIRSSVDGTSSWRESLLVDDGPAGYSDLVETADHTDNRMLGVFYENGPRYSEEPHLTYHKRITFARVPLQLLDVPIPPPSTTPDASGHGMTAVVSGSPKRIDGVFGRALELAGDYVEVPYDPFLDLGAGPFTATIWFRTSFDLRMQRILHAFNHGGFPQWRLEVTRTVLRARIITDAGSTTLEADASLRDGQWHHAALRRGDQNVLRLYVDGVPAAQVDAVPGSVSAGPQAGVRIGSRLDGINHPFVGAVDEVYLFDRALTSEQIRELATTNTAPEAPLFHLPLDIVR